MSPELPTPWIGLGVAGNVAGHLEQAGEASDFVGVRAAEGAPKGLFPFYVPGSGEHFLNVDPISSQVLAHPGGDATLQVEPEVALLCELVYDGDRLASIAPTHFAAFDDCSIRRPDARKISEKKSWGPASKGCSDTHLPIDRFSAGGCMDRFRIASYLERDGTLEAYGIDSPLLGYSYFHERLLDWVVDRGRHQTDQGPLECIADWLIRAGRPPRALLSIGATRYTPLGEKTFVEPGDRTFVVVYDGTAHSPTDVREALRGPDPARVLPSASLLARSVVARGGRG